MECPKCAQFMEKVVFSTIEIDRCIHCGGMWFDMLKHEKLKKIRGSEAIDIGNKALGKQYNEVDRIHCPVCKTPMIRMVDKDQHHLWYEACGTCYGVYFDAGEFKDYKKETLLDAIKDLFTPARQ
ncbi:MAG: zf-TFIIB domain-containing protein [Gammaproteobacteria bacterium]|nr:zf-TFIIB domain-containing protein [Gammaproteobacteria bacterium]